MAGTEGANFCGVPLSLISLVTLTCQNSALTILLHISRTRAEPGKLYSAASAVLLNELLKGTISISVAYRNVLEGLVNPGAEGVELLGGGAHDVEEEKRRREGIRKEVDVEVIKAAASELVGEIFSRDCWKLGCPAILYVIQNNLQFVAASNLDVPTFQVTYNLKILTTALFSVLLLRRRLTSRKWGALAILFLGVAIVQLQSTAAASGGKIAEGEKSHEMNRVKGLMAVAAACMTSGLAGCYFELVLKGSKVDLWVRNAQLCVFSIVPAVMPVFFPNFSLFNGGKPPPAVAQPIFAYFGGWAWAVVLFQVMGGLVTALVIKFSDNIMKGFATSLAIVLSFVAGVILFNFHVTLSFLVGTSLVVGSTYLYNQPDPQAARTHRLLTIPKEDDDDRFNLTPPTTSYRPNQQSWLDHRNLNLHQSPALANGAPTNGVLSPPVANATPTRHASHGSLGGGGGGVAQFAAYRRASHNVGPATPETFTHTLHQANQQQQQHQPPPPLQAPPDSPSKQPWIPAPDSSALHSPTPTSPHFAGPPASPSFTSASDMGAVGHGFPSRRRASSSGGQQ